MTTRVLAVVILAGALGCSTTPPPPESSSGGEFGSEGTSDPGMGARSTTPSSLTAGDLRTIYFDFDDHSLRADARDGLRHNARVLQGNPNLHVVIEGNCDERGSAEYNLALGRKRAEEARRYLADLGIDVMRITTRSYGEENPAVRASTETAWAQNRRDEFRVR